MPARWTWYVLVGTVMTMAASQPPRAEGPADAPEPRGLPRPRAFRIQVVDEETGRGVPLVELRTVNQVRFVTDSNGIAAFDEPGLFGHKVYFSISSHGHEARKDSFGFQGKTLEITEGGSARIAI